METDERTLTAAAFLAQALDLADDPAGLVPELVAIDLDPTVAIFAAELDSSVGPTAFLIYVYALAATDAEGRSGRDRFEADLATLQTAAERDAPGPRAVAHALTAEDGLILATTPATLRALTGESAPAAIEATPADLLPTGDPIATRRAAAEELLRLLRAADAETAAWLAAVQATRRLRSNGEAPSAMGGLSLTPEEAELALFLLDDRSIRDLLRALDQILSTARERSRGAMDGEG